MKECGFSALIEVMKWNKTVVETVGRSEVIQNAEKIPCCDCPSLSFSDNALI
jgi:hypothetical protein